MTGHVWRTGAEQRAAPRLTIRDALSLVRLTSVPILWIVAFVRGPFWLGIGLAAAAFTDVLDGQIARRSRRTTARGSQLDSIADHVLTASTVLWLVWFRPDFIAERLPWLATWGILGVTALVVSWVRFRRIGDLHLYSAKVAGLMGYLFAIWLLLFGTYNPTVFYVLMATVFVGSAESLLVVATRETVTAHVGSIFLSSDRR